jgi:hypothetical protein
LVREGVADIHQHKAFAPLYVRKRQAANENDAVSGPAGVASASGSTVQ